MYELSYGLRGAYYVFWREMKRFLGQRMRILMALVQPIIWLVFMGNMMSRLTDNPATAAMLGVDNYLTFMVPGVMVMSSLYTGVFGGISIIWDRRMGFLIKLLSAPIPRYSIALGKMAALVLQSIFQNLAIVILASFLGVSFASGPGGALLALLVCGLFAAIMSSVSLFLSASIRTPETLFAVVNFLTLPLVFTSSALFPAAAMPPWIQAFALVNPVSYAVNPVRNLIAGSPGQAALLPEAMILPAMFFLALAVVVTRFEKGSLL